MAKSLIICGHCGKESLRQNGHINRTKKEGRKLFCNQKCFGLSRRDGKSIEQKKQEKRDYDKEYRSKNREMLKTKKKQQYERRKDEIEAKRKILRKTPEYKEYRRRYLATDKYKNYKHKYDRVYRCKKKYGEYWEAASVLIDIEKELTPHKYETKKINKTLNKAQTRRRDYERTER